MRGREGGLAFDRRAAAAALFVLLALSSIRLPLLRALIHPFAPLPAGPADGLDRKPLRLREDPTPPALAAFLEGVRADSRPGEAVAVLCAAPEDGFSYTYWRASFVLAGREVLLPEPHLDLTRADVVATWGRELDDPRFVRVWSDPSGGAFWRKR